MLGRIRIHNLRKSGECARSPGKLATKPSSNDVLNATVNRAPEDRPLLTGRAEQLDRLQSLLGYRFRDSSKLDLALTHSSVAYERQAKHCTQDDNEQLEFVGDAVLGLAITEHLFRTYPELTEGQLTRLRAQFVSRQHLGCVGQRLNLGDYLQLGKGEERSGGRKKSAIVANAVEAIVAAVYLDGGLEAAARLVRDLVLDATLETLAADLLSGKDVSDHKSRLQEYLQLHGLGRPRYIVTSETGPDHHKNFAVAVAVSAPGKEDAVLAFATGMRKKAAEQEAARLALERLAAEVGQIGPTHSVIVS